MKYAETDWINEQTKKLTAIHQASIIISSINFVCQGLSPAKTRRQWLFLTKNGLYLEYYKEKEQLMYVQMTEILQNTGYQKVFTVKIP